MYKRGPELSLNLVQAWIVLQMETKAQFPYDRSRWPDRWKYCQRLSAITMETLFSDWAIVSDYMETLFRNRAIVGDLRFSDSEDPAIVSVHMEARLKASLNGTVQAHAYTFQPHLSKFPRFGRPERENWAPLIHEQGHSGQNQFWELVRSV